MRATVSLLFLPRARAPSMSPFSTDSSILDTTSGSRWLFSRMMKRRRSTITVRPTVSRRRMGHMMGPPLANNSIGVLFRRNTKARLWVIMVGIKSGCGFWVFSLEDPGSSPLVGYQSGILGALHVFLQVPCRFTLGHQGNRRPRRADR